MLERIVRFTLEQRGLVLTALALVVLAGLYSLLTLPVDAFPDVTGVQVEVVAQAPGLSPLEIERGVTAVVEMSMRGLPRLQQMRSLTKFGIAVVTLIFEEHTDIYFARQQIFQRLGEVEEKLPPGASLEMGPVATAMGEIYHYTLEGRPAGTAAERSRQLTEWRTLQDWVISPLLKSIPGVNEVNSFGGYVKQYQVVADPQRLQSYGLTIADLAEALQHGNENVGGGVIERFAEQSIIRGIGLIGSEADLGAIALKASGGAVVRVSDVARVEIGQFLRQGAAWENGTREVVGGVVMMLRGENSREVVRRVQARVQEINSSRILPPGVRIVPYYERSQIIASSIGTVSEALAAGALLVLAVLFLFLRSARGTLVVILALPLSLLLTFALMKWGGLDANLMSLGGLAISIGMIIDATIIQVENVRRRLGSGGADFRTVVREAVLEVRKPSIFGELIIAVTFVPILTLQGMEGKMFIPLALTVAAALLASLLLSIFAMPVLCAVLLKPEPEKESLLMRGATRLYRPLLAFTLRHRAAVLAGAGLLLLGALLLIPRLGTEFMPVMDEGAFDMDVQMLPGVSLDESLAVNREIQRRLMRFPELQTLIGRTGQSGISLEARGVDKTGYTGMLRPRSQWRPGLDRDRLLEEMRRSIGSIPGIAFGFSQPIQCRIDELMAGSRAQLIVRLFGEDNDVLKRKADEIAAVLRNTRGSADLTVEQVAGQPTIAIRVRREMASRYGLNSGDVLETVQAWLAGRVATRIREGDRTFDCLVRGPDEVRQTGESIAALPIRGVHGEWLPLGALADISREEGPAQISRDDGQRRIAIELNVVGRDIGGFVAEARRRIAAGVDLPTGYHLTWGGQFENQQQAMRRLSIIAPFAVLLIMLMLYFTFRSLRLALLVVLNLPFALVGGIFSLYLTGSYLSVPASIGFIVLFGVAVLNGLVLVSQIAQGHQAGMGTKEAVCRGCEVRLRPVLMTATIAILSLLPMLTAGGPGAEVQRPLAVVVIGGLFSSTLLTLLLLPTLYPWFAPRPTGGGGDNSEKG